MLSDTKTVEKVDAIIKKFIVHMLVTNHARKLICIRLTHVEGRMGIYQPYQSKLSW